MRTLYHYWLCPFSRKVRILLSEKELEFNLSVEEPWSCKESEEKNCAIPVLIDANETVVSGSLAICNYLEETYPEKLLTGEDLKNRIEILRLIEWFDQKFYCEVTRNFVFEKVLKKHFGFGGPDSNAIRQGNIFIHEHFEYISWLADRRTWLAGEDFSLADITAAAHISAIDFIDCVPWSKYPEVKNWYVRIKSRPSFRALLNDHVPALRPPSHYSNLDF